MILIGRAPDATTGYLFKIEYLFNKKNTPERRVTSQSTKLKQSDTQGFFYRQILHSSSQFGSTIIAGKSNSEVKFAQT